MCTREEKKVLEPAISMPSLAYELAKERRKKATRTKHKGGFRRR